MVINNIRKYYKLEKEVAIIDDTYNNDVKVILIDEELPYIQRFYIQLSDKELVDNCKMMRKLLIKSL